MDPRRRAFALEHIKLMGSSAENEQFRESQKTQAVSCFLPVRFSGFGGFCVCVFQHFTMKIPFNQGFSESNLAKFSYVLLARELRF